MKKARIAVVKLLFQQKTVILVRVVRTGKRTGLGYTWDIQSVRSANGLCGK